MTPAVARPARTPVAIHAARDEPVRSSVARIGSPFGARQRQRPCRPHTRRREPVHPFEQGQGFFAVRAALDGRRQQRSRDAGVAALERRGARVQQLLAFALTLGDGAAGALDVGPGARMAAIEEQDPRPDADGELVLTGKIMVEAGEEQVFDARVALALRHFSALGEVVGPQRVGHRK